jgi:hypothetical protein
MDTMIILFIVGLAVLYLYRRFAESLKKGAPSCGCDSCGVRCGTKPSICENHNGLMIPKQPIDGATTVDSYTNIPGKNR